MTLPFADAFDYEATSFAAVLRRMDPARHASAYSHVDPSRMPDHVEGTTVIALIFDGGVVVAGDRRATSGNIISRRDMRKVFEADSWSAIGIAGVAGPAAELAKIFATELEHYEKVEGFPLSLEGKANKLSQMVRANLPLAMQGIVVVPLFAGYDPRTGRARIYEFDAIGGRYEERGFAATGSGSRDARGSLKARYRDGLTQDEAVDTALQALWDAADEDSATGGPDLVRRIYPLVAVIDADGYREVDEDDVAQRVRGVVDGRSE